MLTRTLRQAGGSVVLALPPTLLALLALSAGDKVGLSIFDGQLVIHPLRKKKYTLEELLAQCDYSDGLPKRTEHGPARHLAAGN